MPRFAIILTFLYGSLLAIVLFKHEVWADEAHHFLLAAKSNSLSELYINCRYEGHPPLWNILLFSLTRFTHNIFYMQLLNALIATGGTFLIFRFAPFSLISRLAMAFGYFNFFEFGVISRNYALLFLGIITYCIIASRKEGAYKQKIILLLILSLTHLFGLFAAAGLFIADFSDNKNKNLAFKVWSYVLCGVMVIILLAFVIPPGDHMLTAVYNKADWLSPERFKKIAGLPLKAFLHIPNFTNTHAWNKDLLAGRFPFAALLISIALTVIPYFAFRKERKLLMIWYSTFILTSLFVFFSPVKVAPRHSSILMMVFFACCWMNASSFKEKSPVSVNYLNIFLIIQFVAGLIMVCKDYTQPFSGGKAAADYLKNNTSANSVIAMANQGSGAPVSAYLQKELYYPEKKGFGSFASWNTIPFVLPDDSIYERIATIVDTSEQYLVLNHFPSNLPSDYERMATFEDCLVASENYYIYKLKKRE